MPQHGKLKNIDEARKKKRHRKNSNVATSDGFLQYIQYWRSPS